MPFGWGANPNSIDEWTAPTFARTTSPMPFGWGANPNTQWSEILLRMPSGHQCLSAGGLIQTLLEHVLDNADMSGSPMPFGWGANPNRTTCPKCPRWTPSVTNAFRLGG